MRDICYAGLFAAVIAVMAQISIPMPLGVPSTMQTFAITLAAVVLGSKLSAIASLVYLALGAVGVPVLAKLPLDPAVNALVDAGRVEDVQRPELQDFIDVLKGYGD